ncbi:MAG: hypothetical protein KatS3mg109_1278 [Pirellulaceae bacterium]|nr:MAG: hypothetical protein KatS3mg109_1248 [Pirellulaceae bacterium]GIW90846.1 MAG: hypothetical protein KatS3mg109_1278 [Pirellulaceae bacterium]GIW93819.1 MAG: hypothetical protein KatS3mg110_1860 [Pirellulaceae bacterium]
MPAVYERHGVRFQYPENWNLIEESTRWPREITLESPSGALWALHVYFPPDSPSRLLQDALKAMQKEYEGIEYSSVTEQLHETATADGYDLYFFYLDFVVECRLRSFTYRDKTFLLITQAEEREYQQLEPVFRAMTTSLVRHLAGQV